MENNRIAKGPDFILELEESLDDVARHVNTIKSDRIKRRRFSGDSMYTREARYYLKMIYEGIARWKKKDPSRAQPYVNQWNQLTKEI